MRAKIAPFVFQPFSKKQLQVLTWWLPQSPVHDRDIIIADGAIRSGKTVSMALSYVQWSMHNFEGENFGMAGKTIGSFRRNVLAPLKRMLRALRYKTVEHRSDNMLEIKRGGKTNYYYLFGGKDESSQDLIQGITLAGMLFDEVALMPQSFVNQATARCSVNGSRLWFNCNPGGLYHWFRTDYVLDLLGENKLNGLYLHFTMDDNLSLGEKIKERYRRQYKGVFYKRYIKGEWALAEGAVYDMFDEDKHVVKIVPGYFEKIWIASDYGTGNPTVFLLQGRRGNSFYTLREYYYDSKKEMRQKTDAEYSRDLKKFVAAHSGIIKGAKIPIWVDPSAASFIQQLRKDGFAVKKADNDVLNGIRYVGSLYAQDRHFIHASCKHTIGQTSSYVWDEKAQSEGIDKPVKINDHAVDADRYGIYSNRLGEKYSGYGQQTGRF